MQKGLLAAAAVIATIGCGGSSSTGPTPSTNKNYTITVQNSGFTPDSVTVAAHDTVTWRVSEGTHAVTFFGTLPPHAAPSSGAVTAGNSVYTVFITPGRYTFRDDSLTANTGVVIVQ